MVYFGFFYLLLGTIFLFLPLISIEFGRPRDLMKSALYLIIGVTLITKNNFHDNLFIPYMFCVSLLISFHVLEIFSFRFNLLTSQEKNKLSSLIEIKKNISKFLHAVSLVFKNFSKSIKKYRQIARKIKKCIWFYCGSTRSVRSSCWKIKCYWCNHR